MEPGYDYYVINQYNSNYYLSYHTAEEIESYTVSIYNSSNLKVSMSRKLWYYMFNSMADLLSFLRFNSSTCDVSSLSTKKDSDNEYFYVKRSGVIMTNCPSLKTKFSDAGYAPDESYYAYFHNTDSKKYVLCFVTVSGVDSPVAVFAKAIPTYDSSTQELRCDSGMYGFWSDTIDGALNFLKNEDGSALTKIDYGMILPNVTSFVASNCDIIDTSSGLVFFHAKDLDGNDIGDLDINNMNPDDLAVKDHLEPGMISRLLGVANDIIQGITAIPILFGWLPSGFSIAINSILVVFVVLLIVLIVLKIIHG